MRDKLWINRWDDRRKNSARQKGNNGKTFITNYTFDDYRNVFIELCQGLNMVQGSQSSYYLTFIPSNNQEVIKLRISDHPSNEQEWKQKEVTGLPNRRYSIVLFSNRSMPQQSSEGIKETNWSGYLSQNIPVYEKCFNRYYLNETFNELKSIIAMIFEGQSPEDKTIQINLNEYKENTMNTNKKVIRLTESDLHKIIEESFNNILGNKRPINEDIDISQHLVSSLLKIYWRLNNCYGRWAFARDKSQGADNMIETMGNAIKWIAKVIEKIDPTALPM